MSREKRQKHGSVVPFSSPRAQSRLAEFLETAERLKQERAAAGAVIETVEATPPDAWPSLASQPEFQTNAALERLGDEVRRRLDRNPREALALAELATTIADALPPTAYPAVTLAQIRAMAWKDRASALRFLGRIPEALDGIQVAERILEKHVALGLDRAVVDMVKAMTLVDTGEFEEARAIAITCGSVFLAHGDLARALTAGEIEGHVLYESQQFADAHTLFRSLIEVARVVGDLEAEARCHHNIASCAIQMGDYKTANIHFSEAMAKLTDLGQPVAAARTQMGAGRVFVGKGQIDNGVRHLNAARQTFTQFSMYEEVGLCGLYIAEALLSRGEEVAARRIVHEVASQLRDSPLERRVIEAVSALEQEIVDNDAPSEAVRHVYTLIEAAQSERSHL